MPDKRRTPDLPKRILFLNDVGFQYGAGIAQARQLECIMGLGIEAGVLTWAHGDISLEKVATRMIDSDLWLGIRQVNHLEGNANFSPEALITGLLLEVARFNPEIVLVGNLHAARWPFQLLPALRSIGCRVLTFLHDAYLYTGRCAYPGSCQLYLTGCNDTCPTAGQYPSLAPALIADAWQTRRDIFGGPHGVEVIANSLWSKKMFQTALPAVGHIETIELSANEDVFRNPPTKPPRAASLACPTRNRSCSVPPLIFKKNAKVAGNCARSLLRCKTKSPLRLSATTRRRSPVSSASATISPPTKSPVPTRPLIFFSAPPPRKPSARRSWRRQLCGLPVVAFMGGVSEIVRNEITGETRPQRRCQRGHRRHPRHAL